MRRSQSTLLMTLLVVSGLFFVSQLPAISNVGTTNPNFTDGDRPPVTDSDRDKIPDVHENLFSEWVNFTSTDGRAVVMKGMDRDNASDASIDIDIDGLNATEEYCWPYPAECTEPSFSRGLTGVINESGERWYLDPRVSDTDGDGMPDGFEAHMCEKLGGFDSEEKRFECDTFDPLNASDADLDPDEDGFDVNRDGFLTVNEMLTSPEEYSFGAPANWTNELDGLRCYAPNPGASILYDWPFISENENYTLFENILSACARNGTSDIIDEYIWLGTNPVEDDSDRFNFDGVKHRRLFPSSGDGIKDGWEIHFGLDPLNRSNALLDLDNDGWDTNRDGIISVDAARSVEALALGEQLSTLEEYFVHLDDDNTVKSGMRSVELGAKDGTYSEYLLTPEAGVDDISILNHDVRELRDDGTHLWVGSKLGITIIDFETSVSTDHPLPQGHDLHDMVLLDTHLVMMTELGTWIAGRDSGTMDDISLWQYFPGKYTAGTQLINDGGDNYVLALGYGGFGSVFQINGASISKYDVGTGISDAMNSGNATATSIVHVDVTSGPLTLYVGTDVGLFTVETASARDASIPNWKFYYSLEPTSVASNINDLRALGAQGGANPAIVNDLISDGPEGGASQAVWIGLPSGIHRMDLQSGLITYGGDLEHPGVDGVTVDSANSIHSLYSTGEQLIVGSGWGMWSLNGGYAAVYGMTNQEWVPGMITAIVVHEVAGVDTVFLGIGPGKYSNLELMDPMANDSDADGMLDGWEVRYGLDPTDPWDADLDADGDGVNLNDDPINERLWTNLDEFRYTAITNNGYDATDPRSADTDNDGVGDGAEYFGLFHEFTPLWCHYTNQYDYEHICGDAAGLAANATYLASLGIDARTDATNPDSDGDGMPDGWEIENRRWIGTTFTGSNNWTMDPMDPADANWDADGDGLSNLCEYQWTLIKAAGIAGDLLESHLESELSAESWANPDPNNVDSDGDGLPDGWEARGACTWDVSRAGINPLNGSDAFENPDGDGYDINHNGVIEDNEAFVNWLEYNVRDNLYSGNMSFDGELIPDNFTTDLFMNISDWGVPESNFGDGELTGDPTDADSDSDGMPDGWEIWYARWHLLEGEWSLNPLDSTDRWDDSDEDGMTNWEEYNSIAPSLSETNSNRSSPQWYVTTVGAGYTFQQWSGITNPESFGSFVGQDLINISGYTTDPTNPDTDSDGFLDGLELMFTAWNDTAQTWTLNPLVPGDGTFDADDDALTDAQEFSLASINPVNGENHPLDAPLMHIDGDLNDPTQKSQRVFNIISDKGQRGKRHLAEFTEWQSTGIANTFISTLMSITDPTISDTDDDGMIDGFEYWFTSWDLENNRWSMNPLIDSDQWLDSDQDSVDCDRDGNISLDEQFTNKREYESRVYGKYTERLSTGAGLIGFGDDAIDAYVEEGSTELEARRAIFNNYRGRDAGTIARMDMINLEDDNTFNRTLFGISDPTYPDTDGDGINDGWEFCYAVYGLPDPSTQNHWATNPVNPFDVDYDPDSDGWYGRTSFDIPAAQGTWEDRVFTPSGDVIQNGIGDLPFTNYMEYLNGTRPDSNDSDGDAITFNTAVSAGVVTAHDQDWNLSDGREVFKYGINPMDNDTDGDMLPDWYEYEKGWNESNDNFSSRLNVEVQWIDASTGGVCNSNTTSCRPLSQNLGTLSRPNLGWTWATFDPADALDANEDPDQDGNWDCSATCVYTPYTNFMEFYAIANPNLDSPDSVRLSGETWEGSPITEWWQFRAFTLGLGEVTEDSTNYLGMNRKNIDDESYVLVIDDMDNDFLVLDSGDDVTLCSGDLTSDWDLYYVGNTNRAPSVDLGEHEFGWYLLDLDGDHIAEGSDPLNWDTDGDWMVDWFEVKDDEVDGLRGDSSPIRYDSRNTA
jgi:hypothetical protein